MNDSTWAIVITWAGVFAAWTLAALLAGPFIGRLIRGRTPPPALGYNDHWRTRKRHRPDYQHITELETELGLTDPLAFAAAATQPMAAGGWKVQDCGCHIRLNPPGFLTCTGHAAQEQEILDLLLWRSEMRSP